MYTSPTLSWEIISQPVQIFTGDINIDGGVLLPAVLVWIIRTRR